MTDAQTDAAGSLEAHGRSIDDLHRKLAAMPGVDQGRLQQATDTYKAAHQQYCDDALGCMQ